TRHPGGPRRRAARRRHHHARDRPALTAKRSSRASGTVATSPRAPALPHSESAPTLVAPAHSRALALLSDLHLAENTPNVFEAWAAHLRHTDADAVFILGDLFEVWIGDDMAERGFEARCAEVLTAAAAEPTVGFMAGNRDFLVGGAML